MKYQLIDKATGQKVNGMTGELFFSSFFTSCQIIQNHLAFMRHYDYKEINLTLAKREINSDYFYCKFYDSCGTKHDRECGKLCDAYKPKNGKSGACVHLRHVYEETDREFILRRL